MIDQYNENIFPIVQVFSPFMSLKLSKNSMFLVSADKSFKYSHNLSMSCSNIKDVENKK